MRFARLIASAALSGAAVLATAAVPAQAAPQADHGRVTALCSTSAADFTVRNVSRPINHQLLTVTNTGAKSCNLLKTPLLAFDDDTYVGARAIEDSKPQAVVTLKPGESAYAGIVLSSADGSGENGRHVRTLHVFLDRGEGSEGGPDTLALPKNTWIDDSAAVTYWQADAADALVW
ncbi:hypothetical protein AF335_13565 [Streptomyces eurocidicus]|uniref:DUF4232 domain-containing protein n=1 Tax=Streptomyces eurocidicus TaxID=66423 RepID=A0A2N8NYH6_STREU|nr:DUF4232 domain-containing protein [Streptomyces eurocidicus]MBB5121379.1 hypothetical protein [Streptomyces eurocidicus]MBF6050983.1 DUF4232 domain-containing protein [Streptomyces eurocidicus]PNE33821.1 hypothetical protein AF335_13565 [Streptomyces eurocidicus]